MDTVSGVGLNSNSPNKISEPLMTSMFSRPMGACADFGRAPKVTKNEKNWPGSAKWYPGFIEKLGVRRDSRCFDGLSFFATQKSSIVPWLVATDFTWFRKSDKRLKYPLGPVINTTVPFTTGAVAESRNRNVNLDHFSFGQGFQRSNSNGTAPKKRTRTARSSEVSKSTAIHLKAARKSIKLGGQAPPTKIWRRSIKNGTFKKCHCVDLLLSGAQQNSGTGGHGHNHHLNWKSESSFLWSFSGGKSLYIYIYNKTYIINWKKNTVFRDSTYNNA